jgi:hypothetical protein
MGNDQVYVTNTNKFDHVDSYDGEEYVFPQGERVLIPADAAVHFFGRGLLDKSDALVRLGWAMKYDVEKKQFVENTDGVKRLAAFVFEEAVISPKSSLEQRLAEAAKATAAA